MINGLRDEYGAIKINELNYEFIKNIKKECSLIKYSDSFYYLKRCVNLDRLYNEMIVEEMANDFGIKCSNNDIYVDDEDYGYISESVTNTIDEYKSIDNLLSNTEYGSNLYDLWNYFEKIHNNKEIINDIVKLFLFDILIGNSDRHSDNYGIINSSIISLAPIFDNEYLFSDNALYEKYFSILIEADDAYKTIGTFNMVNKFFKISDSRYLDFLKNKLWIIDYDNMINIFDRVEKRLGTNMHNIIKNKILIKSKEYLNVLKTELSG